MPEALDEKPSSTETKDVQHVVKFLGGRSVLRRHVRTTLEAHDLLSRGIPGTALTYLVSRLVSLSDPDSLEKAFGMSVRTIQRRKEDPTRLLSQEQSGRTWKFAEILARAVSVFGSQEDAENWLRQPAMALDRRRPIDLLATPAGVEAVEELLERLEYGVYV